MGRYIYLFQRRRKYVARSMVYRSQQEFVNFAATVSILEENSSMGNDLAQMKVKNVQLMMNEYSYHLLLDVVLANA